MIRMQKRQVGVHVSIAGSLTHAFDRAQERGCDCFQIFTKNPRGWQAKSIDAEEKAAFAKAVTEYEPGLVFAHISYLPNLASDKPDMHEKSVDALIMELTRCSALQIPFLVTHLGHAGDNPKEGRKRVVQAIDTALSEVPGETILLLENTAGEKHSVGSTIGDIADVFGKCQDPTRIGICFDTCHGFAAGYDLRDEQSVGTVVDLIDESVGVSSVRLLHLNDAKGELGSGLDRHEHIGLGSLGNQGIRSVLFHSGFQGIPCICETPIDDRRGDIENIRAVRELMIRD